MKGILGPAGARSDRGRPSAAILFGLFVATLLVVGAASPVGATLYTHPWKGIAPPFVYSTTYGCSSASVTHSPWFKLKTGLGGFAGAVSSKSGCPNGYFSAGNESQSTQRGGASLAVKVLPNTFDTNISVWWSINATLTASESAGSSYRNCPATLYPYVDPSNAANDYNQSYAVCYVESEVWLSLSGALYDLSNGTIFAENSTSMGYCYVSSGVTNCYDQWYAEAYNYTYVDWIEYGPGSAVCPSGCIVSYNSSSASASSVSNHVSVVSQFDAFSSNSTSYTGNRSGWYFVSSDQYALYETVEVLEETYAAGFHAASAKASVSMPKAGGWDLDAITTA